MASQGSPIFASLLSVCFGEGGKVACMETASQGELLAMQWTNGIMLPS